MKMSFQNYNTGKKLIIFSLFIAIVSLFLPWGYSDSKPICGIVLGAYILLLIFAYPLISLFLNKKINKIASILISIIGITALMQMRTINILEVEATMIASTGVGLYIFILSLVILIIGVSKYKIDPKTNKIKNESKLL